MMNLYESFSPPGNLGDVPAPPMRPPSVDFLGSVPRGFFEIGSLDECGDSSPSFVRGLLMPRGDYDALSQSQQLSLHLPPRWTLYGGPLPTRAVAQDWETYLHFWAPSQGLIWVEYPGSPLCVVASHRIPWPPNSAFAWTWVREVEYPRRVVRDKSSVTLKYVWEAPGG